MFTDVEASATTIIRRSQATPFNHAHRGWHNELLNYWASPVKTLLYVFLLCSAPLLPPANVHYDDFQSKQATLEAWDSELVVMHYLHCIAGKLIQNGYADELRIHMIQHALIKTTWFPLPFRRGFVTLFWLVKNDKNPVWTNALVQIAVDLWWILVPSDALQQTICPKVFDLPTVCSRLGPWFAQANLKRDPRIWVQESSNKLNCELTRDTASCSLFVMHRWNGKLSTNLVDSGISQNHSLARPLFRRSELSMYGQSEGWKDYANPCVRGWRELLVIFGLLSWRSLAYHLTFLLLQNSTYWSILR